ncbi:MAG: transposase [Acidobacteriota bacterium]
MSVRREPTQPDLFPRHGGKRAGAGRPRSSTSDTPHRARPEVGRSYPLHLTLRLHRDVGRVRNWQAEPVLRKAFRKGRERFGFRLVHYSVQDTHLHLIVETDGKDSLYRGATGLAVRIARGLNRLRKRRGQVIAERYHVHVLKTPREVKNALRYVLNNAAHHLPGPPPRVRAPLGGTDVFSTGVYFDGWREQHLVTHVPPHPPPRVPPRTWLLRDGWKRLGPIGFHEIGPSRPGAGR